VNIPGGLNGNSAITVTNNGKTSNVATYAVPIAVTAMSSTAGNVGDSLTLTVTGYAPNVVPTTVSFPDGAGGSVTATVTGSTASTITVTVPAGAVTGPITLQPEGLATLQTPTYTIGELAITNVTAATGSTHPANGPYVVGQTVTVTGIKLDEANTVTIGGQTATFVKNPDGTLTVTIPANPGSGKLVVTTDEGSVSQDIPILAPPIILQATPVNPNDAEPSITLEGGHYTTVTQVTIGGEILDPADYTIQNDGTLVITNPPDNPVLGPITVTNPAGTAITTLTYKNVINYIGANTYPAPPFVWAGPTINVVTTNNTPKTILIAPHGINVDTQGNIYVADLGYSTGHSFGHAIHKFQADGTHLWSTGSAINGTLFGTTAPAGYVDHADKTLARFNAPEDVANDLLGNIYVTDTNNHAIRKISPDGQVTTIARVPGPEGLQVAPDGKLYITANYPPNPSSTADMQFAYVVRIDNPNAAPPADLSFSTANPSQMSANVTVIAGGTTNCITNTIPAEVSPVSDVKLCHVEGIGVDGDGHIYVADVDNYQLRKLTLEPGGGTATIFASFAGAAPATSNAPRVYMHEIRVDRAGNVFVPAPPTNVALGVNIGTPAVGVYMVTPSGKISLIAGRAEIGLREDGTTLKEGSPLTEANFSSPRGVDFGLDGSLYIADTTWGIRKIERYHPVANLQVP